MHTSIFKGIFLRGEIEILSLLQSELRRIVCVLYELLVASRKHLVFSSKGLCYVDFHLQIAGVPIYWIIFFYCILACHVQFKRRDGEMHHIRELVPGAKCFFSLLLLNILLLLLPNKLKLMNEMDGLSSGAL